MSQRNKRLPQDPVDWKPNPKHLKYLEIPLFATLGMAVLSMVAYFAYVNGDEFAKGNADIKYIPFKSDYEDIRNGFRNIRKRFFKSKPVDDVK